MTSDCIDSLIESITFFKHLKRLDLFRNNINDVGMIQLFDHISMLTSLIELSFGENPIGDNSIITLTKQLKYISKLEELLFPDVTDNGIINLSSNLSSITNLVRLSIRNNRISEIGMNELVQHINICAKLKEIYIVNNVIDNFEEIKKEITENHPNSHIRVFIVDKFS